MSIYIGAFSELGKKSEHQLTIYKEVVAIGTDSGSEETATKDVSSDNTGNGLLGRAEVCPSRSCSQKLHVSELFTVCSQYYRLKYKNYACKVQAPRYTIVGACMRHI